MEYKIVYEVTNSSIKSDWLFSILMISGGLFLFFYNRKSSTDESSYYSVFGVGLICMGLFFLITDNLITKINLYNETQEIYRKKQYDIVEGAIEYFDPMPYNGHKHESFRVNGVYFNYSDYDGRYYGFNNTASHGGPLKANGQRVRLAYITREGRNIILRIELKGK